MALIEFLSTGIVRTEEQVAEKYEAFKRGGRVQSVARPLARIIPDLRETGVLYTFTNPYQVVNHTALFKFEPSTYAGSYGLTLDQVALLRHLSEMFAAVVKTQKTTHGDNDPDPRESIRFGAQRRVDLRFHADATQRLYRRAIVTWGVPGVETQLAEGKIDGSAFHPDGSLLGRPEEHGLTVKQLALGTIWQIEGVGDVHAPSFNTGLARVFMDATLYNKEQPELRLPL